MHIQQHKRTTPSEKQTNIDRIQISQRLKPREKTHTTRRNYNYLYQTKQIQIEKYRLHSDIEGTELFWKTQQSEI